MKKTKKHVVIVVVAAVAMLVGGAFGFDVYYKDKFYPNISIGGFHAGGKSYAEVYAHFEKVTDALKKDGFTVTFTDEKGNALNKEIVVPSASVGLTSDTVVEYYSIGDWKKVVNEAWYVGRQGSLWERTGDKLSGWLFRKFKLPVVAHSDTIEALLEDEMAATFERPQDASFAVVGGEVNITPERVERWREPEEIAREISRAVLLLETSSLSLELAPQTPRVTQKELARSLSRARDISRTLTVVLNHEGNAYTLPGPTLVTWLTLDPDREGQLMVRAEPLALFITQYITPSIDNPPINSRFEMRQGRLVETQKGRAGNNVDIEEIRAELARAVNGRELPQRVTLAVEVVRTEPLVTAETIGRYGIIELVGSARTSFAGSSADRRKNISIGISKLSGVLIAPGQEFSTIEGLGEVSVEQGFVEEYVIKGDASVKEIGGGLCQVATTLFRSTLNSGLPITERQNHSYVVGYYGAGLDATIYPPHPDLKFVNDTGRYLLLQGRVEGDEAVFEFYGTKDGRTVAIGTPVELSRTPPPEPRYIPTTELAPGVEHCTERARDGVSTEASYTVTYPNGEVKEKIFKSWYRPWQKVCLIGIAPAP